MYARCRLGYRCTSVVAIRLCFFGMCRDALLAERGAEFIHSTTEILSPVGSVAVNRRWIVPDFLVVELFVLIGRSNHHHGGSFSGIVSTSWPFVVGLGVGWLVVLLRHQNGGSLAAGTEVWLATVAIGMILRVLAGQGTAVAFIAVALVFLGALFLGLRFVCLKLIRSSAKL